jgi:hypothetical protein
MIIISILAAPLIFLHVEVCVAQPEPPAVEPPEWHWRTIDGKKCWFRADKLLPREDLFWEYDAEEFDRMEGATVLDRNHYGADDLRSKVASPDSSRANKRWKPRRRHRDDDDDDDDD